MFFIDKLRGEKSNIKYPEKAHITMFSRWILCGCRINNIFITGRESLYPIMVEIGIPWLIEWMSSCLDRPKNILSIIFIPVWNFLHSKSLSLVATKNKKCFPPWINYKSFWDLLVKKSSKLNLINGLPSARHWIWLIDMGFNSINFVEVASLGWIQFFFIVVLLLGIPARV